MESPTYDARDGTQQQIRKHYDSKITPSPKKIINILIFSRCARSGQILPDLAFIEIIMAELGLFERAEQYRDELVEAGYERFVGIDIDDIDGEGMRRAVERLQGIEHFLAQMAITAGI